MASGLPQTSIVPPDQSSFYEPLPTYTSFRLLHFAQVSDNTGDVGGTKEDGGAEDGGSVEFDDSAGDDEWYPLPGCCLETYDIDHHPPYRALSYTWGQPYYSESGDEDEELPDFDTFDYVLLIDGREFQMTKNLFNALHTLVHDQRIEYIWVDAVCINQADVHTERPQQVSMMGRIFESADEVLIWLGHHLKRVKHFLWSATTFVQIVEQLIEERGETYVFSRDFSDKSFANLTGGYNSLYRLQKAMDFYGRCRVFSRAWIVQEFAKAAKSRMFCGEIEIPTKGLFQLAEWFGKTYWGFDLEAMDSGFHLTPYIRENLWGRLRTWALYHDHFHPPVNRSETITGSLLVKVASETETTFQHAFERLLDGVYQLHAFQVSDPRDTIFAALSFGVHGDTRVIDHIAKPACSASIKSVYTDFAVNMLRHLPKLSLFCYLDTSESRLKPNWPSWVPNWRKYIMEPLSFIITKHAVWDSFEADKMTHDDCFRIDTKRKQLTVAGIAVSSVDAVAKSMEQPSDDEDLLVPEALAWLLERLQLCYTLPKRYVFSFDRSESRVEALRRTIMLNYAENNGSTSSPTEQMSSFWALVAIYLGRGLFWTKHGPAKDKLKEDLDELCSNFGEELVAGEIPSLEKLTEAENMTRRERLGESVPELRLLREMALQSSIPMERYGIKRQLFRAKNGMLGSGSNLVRPGDQIWLLQRMDTPVLLRPTETPDQFKVVGECYLHGCMNGELFKHGYLDPKSAKPVTIV